MVVSHTEACNRLISLYNTVTHSTTGGPASKLPAKETGELWAAARLNLPPGQLRSLPDITADVPGCLAGLKPGMIYNVSRLSANAPRIHPAQVERPRTDHTGQLACTDLLGPLPPSKFGGNRYATNLIVKYVKSAENTADIFTKHLNRAAFQKRRAKIYNDSL